MEFLFGIHGVVLALGLARLLAFVGRQIVLRDRVTISVAHMFWTFLLMMLIVHAWWGLSQHWVSTNRVEFVSMVFLLGTPVFLYLMVSVLTPGSDQDDEIDVSKIFASEKTPLYILACLSLVWESGVVVFVVDATKSIEHHLRLAALIPLCTAIFWRPDKGEKWLDIGLVMFMIVLFFLFLAFV